MDSNVKCTLCRVEDAVGVRSHIIPHQLLEGMLNEKGKKGRDSEISVAIGSRKTEVYFGPRVSLEEIREMKGRDLTDEEIKKQKHHHIQTYLFCKRCENRFGIVETFYDSKNKSKSRNYRLSLVFWMGVLWRMSEVGSYGFAFTIEQQEMIRRILDCIMGDSLEEAVSNIKANPKILTDFSYALIHCPDLGSENKSCTYGESSNQITYKVMINDYCLYFHVSPQEYIDEEILSFCGFEDVYDDKQLNTQKTKEERRIVVSIDAFNSNMRLMAEAQAKKLILDPTEKAIRDLFREAFGREIPEQLLEEALFESVDKTMKLRGYFSVDVNVIKKVLVKNCKLFFNAMEKFNKR